MKRQAYHSHGEDRVMGPEYKKGTWYRFFRPIDADYNLRDNIYSDRDAGTSYTSDGGKFPSIHNNFIEHE